MANVSYKILKASEMQTIYSTNPIKRELSKGSKETIQLQKLKERLAY